MSDDKKPHSIPLRLLIGVICLLLLLAGSGIFLILHGANSERSTALATRSAPTHSPVTPTSTLAYREPADDA